MASWSAVEVLPFRFVAHLVAVPVCLGGVETEFIVDSGIGVTLVSDELAAALGAERTGATYSGRRMSGQAVELSLAKLPSLELGTRRWTELEIAVFDMGGAAGLDGISGFFSLSPFDATGVTIDYPARTVNLEEPSSLAKRVAVGHPVPVDVERDGPSVVVYMSLDLNHGGAPIRAEVDMGSDCLILDTRLAEPLGIDLEGDGVKRVEGTDETGHSYVRYFTAIDGAVNPTAAPELSQRQPEVMFQQIIHDGLLGAGFLRSFAVTFDLANARLILGPSAA